ncbi:MAG: branched-chain amino acid transaminase [Acidobacteria bacterium]|nr:branched-chain amino acid transaminase [Acidobacteriota bacterium]
MSMQPVEFIWHNGTWVRWEEATVHVLSHAIHYGTSVFEGIRAYETPKGTAVFRLDDHMKRFMESAHIYDFRLKFTQAELTEAVLGCLQRNELRSAYVRPLAMYGYGGMGLLPPEDASADVYIAAFPWGAYLGEDSVKNGVDAGVSTWRRPAPGTLPTTAKAGGHYLSSRLIAAEAKRHGYREGIALDVHGFVSEGPGENIFLVRNGVIYTPDHSHSLLTGITRDTVMTLARSLGLEVRESSIPREYLYLADEMFFTGTAAEVVPIRTIDGRQVGGGESGPITKQIQEAFFGLFDGTTADHWSWLQHVESMVTS